MTKLAPWVSRLLVVLIGYVAATIALRYVPVSNTGQSVSAAPVVVTASAGPSVLQMANNAAGRHIFGSIDAAPVKPKVEKKRAAPVTRLNLALAGVYAANPADQALAIISANGKPEEVFRVGDTITGNAILKQVFPGEVIIDNSGQQEVLKLPEKVASVGRNVGLENLPQGNSQPTNQGGGNQPPLDLPESPKALRDTLVKNPAMLNRLVSAVPYRENGRILGYKLTPKQNGAILESNGVLPGDVVTSVNGIALANQKNGIRALRKLVKATSIDLTILRDGVEVPINIPLE